MKRNIWIVALLVAVIALAALVVRQNQQIKQIKEQPPVAVTTEKPGASSANAPAQRPAEPAPLPEPSPSESATPPSPAPASAPESATQVSVNSGSTNSLFAGLAGMMKNPQMKEMVRGQQKAMLDQTYGPLSKYINLSAEQMDALKSLLSDRQMAMLDASLAAMSGSGVDRKQVAEQVKAITEDYNQKIKELLSPQDYQTFQDYEKTTPERTQVQMFKGALPAEAALTDQQEYDLISAMYDVRKSMPPSSSLDSQTSDPTRLTDDQITEMLKRLDTLNQQYLDRARAILTPQQFQQFQDSLKQQIAMQEMGLKMARQMFGGGSAPKPPAPTPQ